MGPVVTLLGLLEDRRRGALLAALIAGVVYLNAIPLGFAWDDASVAVPWPALAGTADGRPILSGRDRSNPTLDELMTRLRG